MDKQTAADEAEMRDEGAVDTSAGPLNTLHMYWKPTGKLRSWSPVEWNAEAAAEV